MKVKNKIQALYSNEWGRWGIAFLIGMVFFVISSQFCQHVFFINDDENMMYTFSGYYTYGQPMEHYFMNHCLAFFMKLLYSVFNTIPWYSLYHIGMLFIVVVIICKTILKECSKKEIPIFAALLICTGVFFSLYVYPTLLIQFTTTATFAGIGAIGLLLGVDWENDSRNVKILDSILSVVLLVLCYLQRYNVGYVIICFYFGTVVYQFVHINGGNRWKGTKRLFIRQLAIQVLFSLALVFLSFCIDSSYRNTDEWREFKEFDQARFSVTDYPHESFDENPELFESIGWNKALYELAGETWWFFMDPNINTHALKTIASTNAHINNKADFKSVWECLVTLFRKDKIAKGALGIIGLINTIVVATFVFDKKRKVQAKEYLFYLFFCIGAAFLVMYLCYKQRLPLRAFHTIVLPWCYISIILGIRCQTADLFSRKVVRGMLYVLAIVFILICGRYNLSISRQQSRERVEKSMRTLEVEQYVMNNPDMFYVYDTSLTFRYLPFVIYNNTYPSNMMFWGGVGWNSPVFKEQLEMNGLDHLYTDTLLDENTYYITCDDVRYYNKTMRERLINYMRTLYHGLVIKRVDTLGNNINVYKFSLKRLNNSTALHE